MKNILKNLRNLVIGFLSGLFFVNKANAQLVLYGPPPPLYGPIPGPNIMNLLPALAVYFTAFVIAPIAGLFWYRKRGGKKKWPTVVVCIVASFFLLSLIAFLILLYKDELRFYF